MRFEQWPLRELSDDATQDEVLDAYRERIDAVTAAEGYVLVDVVQMHPSDDPSWPETVRTSRAKFLDEHTHDDDEDRFFATGSGVFYLHLQGKVHAVLCEAGDLLSVPGGTTHWFDMGTDPDYCVGAVLPRRRRLGRQLHRQPDLPRLPDLRPARRGPRRLAVGAALSCRRCAQLVRRCAQL